ncbi:sterol desaturase family protein [Chitinophaga ginsengisegetis]|uniref:sterol desaturase family protein n=1 Tax=Chitinophaga ginsengisegetis TaxID=393003 RepID=UPI000DBFDACE|nr:sterol desaturase family protein [Chitinophaga ginsengisegetis]MDR6571153.1 sterol desaturase/sphingolipid hydroxylase (fatty acid hydroxylase superfamily) [Chitinophaga ginsengisegetis]MDR6650887.1 sterol desaturase/sphingolipid hydroxylase (fatty acid hydroxylase superfamily) [Chitinophaga ginsengisegetis]MDR6657226.1 sterol desaturase/sphingolipid hydroxylase (fatty acid hydroxylase superfamily) [Chitinophaga ginsengisegetis]
MEPIIEATVKIFSVSALRYFLLAGIPFILFYLLLPARFKHFKIQQKLASKKDFLREIWYSMQSTLVFTGISVVLLVTPVRQYTMIYSDIHDFPVWYIGVSLVLSLVIHDTYFYWMHRLLHHKQLFKRTHLVHHQSINPSPWTSYSFHVLEAVAEGGVLVVITCVMPMHPLTVLLFTISGFIINVYGHLGYELMPRGFRYTWMFEVFNTSVHHNLHHKKFRGNYGLYFRVWDRTMGTEHPDYVKEYDQLQERRFGHKAVMSS